MVNFLRKFGTLVSDLGNNTLYKFNRRKAGQNSGKNIDLDLDRLALNPISLTLTSYVSWGDFLQSSLNFSLHLHLLAYYLTQIWCLMKKVHISCLLFHGFIQIQRAKSMFPLDVNHDGLNVFL